MNKSFFKNIATLGPIGYLPASGTIASFITILLILALHITSFFTYFGLVWCFFFLGLYVIQRSLNDFVVVDSPYIVIDEVAGCLLTFCGIALSYQSVIIGFCLFRFFDISKRCGVRFFERFNGAWGIMLDDVWAGILSNLILHALNFSVWTYHV